MGLLRPIQDLKVCTNEVTKTLGSFPNAISSH